MYRDDIKLLAKKKNENELQTLIQKVRIHSLDIGIEFGIEQYTILIMYSGKINNERNRTAKSRNNRNA